MGGHSPFIVCLTAALILVHPARHYLTDTWPQPSSCLQRDLSREQLYSGHVPGSLGRTLK